MWLEIFLSVFFIWLVRSRYYHNTFWKYIFAIPGEDGYPIIGNTFENLLLSPESFFEKESRLFKKYPKIRRYYGFHYAGVNLSNPDDAEKVLTNFSHISKNTFYGILHSWLGTGLLTSKGTMWQTRRKILTPAFHFSILQEFVHIFNKETKNLIIELEKLANEPYIDVLKPIAEFTLFSLGETSMGVELNSNSENSRSYKNAIHEMGKVFFYRISRIWLFIPWTYMFSTTKQLERKLVNVLHTFSRNVIKERKEIIQKCDYSTVLGNSCSYSGRKRLAMLDLLLKAKEDGANIDDEGIREEVDTFMFEGHDTTAMAICFLLMLLANHPKEQDEVLKEIEEFLGEDPQRTPTYADLQELKYMERCIKESLRLYPSVPHIGRRAGEDIHSSTGYNIPKGTDLNILIYFIHRSPEIYPNPDKFDPDRFLPENTVGRHPFAYMPFSAGYRNCIGQKFAMLEIKAVLCGILRKFELHAVDTPETIRIKIDFVLRPSKGIKVKFVPREKKTTLSGIF